MKAAILIFPGTNRERDMAHALHRACGTKPSMLWHADAVLDGYDLVVLPGGFSYGDYLRCGAMAAQSPVAPALRRFAGQGGYILGVCNGFQILTEMALLPGALLRNRDLRFLAQDCCLKVESNDSIFTRGYRTGQIIQVPLAHGDGNYNANPETLEQLNGDGLVAFRYSTLQGGAANPNGSAEAIAGILSPNRRILGMMPHPENHTDPILGNQDGAPLFQGMMEALV